MESLLFAKSNTNSLLSGGTVQPQNTHSSVFKDKAQIWES